MGLSWADKISSECDNDVPHAQKTYRLCNSTKAEQEKYDNQIQVMTVVAHA